MKSRHLEMVQELEENLQLTVQENQEWTEQRIKSHYQSKFNSLRRILHLYQEKIKKRNEEWEMKIEALTARNKQLIKEQEAEARRSKEEAQRWQKEKTELLELCSNRLDLLHSQQTSTVQELQMTRQEVSRVQEMLILSAQVATEEVGSTGNQQSEQVYTAIVYKHDCNISH
ncbi:uncharacterized protein LOC128762540 [Synchiropus splendidus]|uniref:uncharacterized protein LOC128762540 n=1 Tax=Synchiropus splendidus TaxID=270530 RepID=UPI00237E3706|nr:uncharacterized protein LOC128762540 [Synchiropus splendidus]